MIEIITDKTPELWGILVDSIREAYDYKNNEKELWDFTINHLIQSGVISKPEEFNMKRFIGEKFLANKTFQSKYKNDFAYTMYKSGYLKTPPTNAGVIVNYVADFLANSKAANKAYKQAGIKAELKGRKTAVRKNSIAQLENSIRRMF